MVAEVFTRPPKHKNVNVDADLTPFKKINSKWIIDLNVPCRTVNLLAGDTEEDRSDLGLSLKDFKRLQKACFMKEERKEESDKLGFIKIKSHSVELCSENKRQDRDLRYACKTHI